MVIPNCYSSYQVSNKKMENKTKRNVDKSILLERKLEILRKESSESELRKITEIEELKRKLNEMENKLKEKEKQKSLEPELNKFQENAKRRMRSDIIELNYYVTSQLNHIGKLQPESAPWVARVKTQLRHQIDASVNDIESLLFMNRNIREKASKQMSDLVQARLKNLQNPKECGRKLVCSINKNCGFGCQLHHITYCFMVAYGTNRTFVLQSKSWRYNPEGWEALFQPITTKCESNEKPLEFDKSLNLWANVLQIADKLKAQTGPNNKSAEEVFLHSIDHDKDPPPYRPLGVPREFADCLEGFHGNPGVWWVGQFVKFLMRPNEDLRKQLENLEKSVDFSRPIVGIHVRRTDKIGIEASLHPIHQYMEKVEEWFVREEMKQGPIERRVFVATDEPKVIAEAKARYGSYEFITIGSFASDAKHKRYSHDGLFSVVVDIYMLSRTNFLVCTMSSQVCRVAYELMQTLHPDASTFYHSLDDVYYYGGQTGHEQIAVFDHVPPPGSDEIELRVGDVINLAGNHQDGYSVGCNTRTNQNGKYPSYKVKELLTKVDYPKYSDNVWG